MTFEEYLSDKKIDGGRFRAVEPARWQVFKVLFEQMHPDSFTGQKKFLLNDLRRQYLLKAEEKPAPGKPAETAPAPSEAKPVRPVVKRPAAVVRKPTEGN